MRKPTLTDYNLIQADVEHAKNADLDREMLQQKLVPWLFVLGPIVVGCKIYSAESNLLFAAVGGFFGGGIAGVVTGAIAVGLWNVIWRKTHKRDCEVLARSKEYQAALDAFEQHQQRLMEAFWVELSGKAFEHELASLYRRLGFDAKLTKYGRDGGIDIFLHRGNRSTIVQCKRYSAPVGVAVVRELYGVLQSTKADSAILASTGGFTQGVVDFAKDKPIELLGLNRIIELQRSIAVET